MIESISAITLATHDMARAVRFYTMLGFDLIRGGEDATFTSFRAGMGFLNLTVQPGGQHEAWWGRIILPHGVSVSFIRPTRMGTSLASPRRCEEQRAKRRLSLRGRRRHGSRALLDQIEADVASMTADGVRWRGRLRCLAERQSAASKSAGWVAPCRQARLR